MKRKAIQRRLTTAVMIATMAMGTAPAMAAASEGGEPGVSAPEGSAEGAEKADAQESAPAEGNTEKAENTEGTTEETTEEVTETPAEEPAEETPAEEEPAEEPAQEEEKQEEEKQEDDAEKSDAEETPAAPEEGETDETPETPAETPAETTGGAGGGAAQEEQAETAVYTYTGKAISPALAEGEAFVGGETEAIAVGTYTARVAKDGAEYDLEWQIAPATLTVTPVYTVKIDDTGLVIDTKVMVDGFVGGEDADTAAGYTAPTVEQPATVDEAKAMKAYGGAAENYVFVYADSVESDVNAIAPMNAIYEDDAPYSEANGEIANGEYTVTANIYIPGYLNAVLSGVTAYPTNPNNPFGAKDDPDATDIEEKIPNEPRYDNAKLVVSGEGENKKYTVTIPIRNEIFTIQEMNSSDDITVVSTERNSGPYGTHDGRITSVTVELNNLSGKYVFGDCVECPTILGADWDVTLRCAVMLGDIGNKINNNQELKATETVDNRYYDETDNDYNENAGFSKTLDLTYAGITIPRTKADLTNAKLKITRYEAGSTAYDEALAKIKADQVGTPKEEPGILVYDLEVVDENDKPIDISDAQNIAVKFYDPHAYNYDGWNSWEQSSYDDNWNEIKGKTVTQNTCIGYLVDEETGKYQLLTDFNTEMYGIQNGTNDKVWNNVLTMKTNKLGRIVAVYNSEKANVKAVKEWDVDDNTVLKFGGKIKTISYNLDKLTASYQNITSSVDADEVHQAIGKDYAEIKGAYKLGVTDVNKASFGDSDYTNFDLIVPVSGTAGDAYNAYIITKQKDGTVTAERLTSTAYDSGRIDVKIVDTTLSSSKQNNRFISLASNISSLAIDGADGSLSYIVIVEDNTPEIGTSLTYNGQEQIGVTAGDNYTVSGDLKATNAGVYHATATLKDGCTWSDGDESKTKDITWEIKKKVLTATYATEIFNSETSNAPALTVKVSGFIKGEKSALTASGEYKVPTVSLPENPQSGQSYELTPTGGKINGNYEFEYVSGKLYYDYKHIYWTSDSWGGLWYDGDESTGTKKEGSENYGIGSASNRYNGQVLSDMTEYFPTKLGTFTLYRRDLGSDKWQVVEDKKIKDAGEYGFTIDINEGWVFDNWGASSTGGYYDHETGYDSRVKKVSYAADSTVKIDKELAKCYVVGNGNTESTIYSDEIPEGSDVKFKLGRTNSSEKFEEKLFGDDTLENLADYKGVKFKSSVATSDGKKYVKWTYDTEGMEQYDNNQHYVLSRNYYIETFNNALSEALEIISPTEENAEGKKVLVADRIARDVDAIKNAAEGTTVTVKLADADVIPDEILAAMKDKDVNVHFIGDNFNYTQNGKKNNSSSGSSEDAEVKTVTANLYVPGEKNAVLGVNAYLTNGANPLGVGGYEKKTPTEPVSNNAKLKAQKDGTYLLELDIPNPVFTLQEIGGCSNAEITDVKYEKGSFGTYKQRISHLTIKLMDKSGEYEFKNCVEYPTLLSKDWTVPLILNVNFSGGSSGLPSNKVSDSELNKLLGTTEKEKEDVLIKVDGGKNLDSNAAISASKVSSGTTADIVEKAVGIREKTEIYEVKAELKGKEIQPTGKVKVYIPAIEDAKKENVKIYLVTGTDKDSAERTELPFTLSEDGKTYVAETEKLGIFAVCVGDEKVTELPIETDDQAPEEKALFGDISGHWAESNIKKAVEKGLFNGVSKDTFAPNAATTRGMFITVLSRMDGVESGQFRTDTYSDVSEKDYFATAVAWAETNNVANGVSGNRFAPKKDITREQMAVMLYRFAQYKGITLDGANETSFTDAAAISDYVKEAVAAMAKAGILSGRENGSFDPKAKATRAETASMLVRFAEKYIK